MALDIDKIGHTALNLLNEVGLDGLSTRKLAAALNIQGPSLYKHFRSKADLLDHMATVMLTESFSGLDQSIASADWLRSLARATRESILRYRDGARLLVTTSPSSPRRSKLVALVSQPLVNGGFEPNNARLAVATIASFVIGWMLNEQNESTRQIMAHGHADVRSAFDEGIEIIVAGVADRNGKAG